jgi:hypothetical protein
MGTKRQKFDDFREIGAYIKNYNLVGVDTPALCFYLYTYQGITFDI